jgi:hypothetical protein
MIITTIKQSTLKMYLVHLIKTTEQPNNPPNKCKTYTKKVVFANRHNKCKKHTYSHLFLPTKKTAPKIQPGF